MATMREILAARKAAAGKAAPAVVTPAGNDQRRTAPMLSAAPTPAEQAILDAHAKAEAERTPARSLGEMTADVPFVFPSDSDSPETATWKRALLAQATELGIVIEPSSEHAWLAITSKHEAEAILLYRLPVLNRVKSGDPY